MDHIILKAAIQKAQKSMVQVKWAQRVMNSSKTLTVQSHVTLTVMFSTQMKLKMVYSLALMRSLLATVFAPISSQLVGRSTFATRRME